MSNDNGSLGRGLESLIPPGHKPSGDQNSPSQPAEEPPVLGPNTGLEPELQPQPSSGPPPAAAFPPRDRKLPKQIDAIFHIEVEKVRPNPDQPRRDFNEEGIKELAASIREFGLLQPIVVRKLEREVPTGTEVEYELLSGERRLLAVKMLGMELVPAIIRNVSLERERLEIAIIENIQRQDLNPIETARAFSRLQDEFRMTQREIAARLGKSREAVANTVRLLDLPPAIQQALEKGEITESHGRLLLTISEPALQQKMFVDLVAHHLTTRELKNRVRAAKPAQARSELTPKLKMFEEKLSAELGAPVSIHQSTDGGKITISFYSDEELDNILERLGGEEV